MTRVSLLAAAAVAMLAAACAGQQTASTSSTSASSISHGTERSHMSAQHNRASPATADTAPTQTAQAQPPAAPPAAAPAMPAAPTTFTDAQLQSFVTASQQIQPLNAQVATATPEQRTALAGQIRTILQQNNLDGATYNAIATQAQSDQALAARLAALQTPPSNG